MLQVGELFAGIGGIGLGLEMTGGFTVKWQVEIDKYATKVLEKNWPEAKRWDDVTTFPPEAGDWDIDVLTAGFPCQDLSYAGKGAGLDGERSGLFYEVMRITERLRPRYLLLENVRALLTRGIDRVLREVAEIGYNAEWHCIPASHVGAPQKRERVFILAYPNSDNRRHRSSAEPQKRQARLESRSSGKRQSKREPSQNVAYPQSLGVQGLRRVREQISQAYVKTAVSMRGSSGARGTVWETEPGLGRVVDGISAGVDRAKRIKALGNAVVPQVAELWGRYILERERCNA